MYTAENEQYTFFFFCRVEPLIRFLWQFKIKNGKVIEEREQTATSAIFGEEKLKKRLRPIFLQE